MRRGRSAPLGTLSPRAAVAWLFAALLLAGCTRGGTPTPAPSPSAPTTTSTLPTPRPGGTPGSVVAPTGTERKVDAILLEILDTYRQQGRAAAERQARDAGVLGADDLVRLTLVLADSNTQPIADRITAAGGTVTGTSGNIVEIEVPLDRWLTYLSGDGKNLMQDLAAFDAVREVRLTPPMHPQERMPPLAALRGPGAITSEGVKAIGADRWQAAGFNGQGVKIGIVDVGYAGYEKLIGSELPPPERLQTRSFSSDRTLGKEPHGTAVAEIIYDLAPDASYWLARIDTNVSTDKAIRWLVDEVGVDLISLSIGSAGYYRGDGSSLSAKAVDYAFSKGVLCLVAAGNEADNHYAAPYADADADGYHEFAPGKADLKITPLSSSMQIILNWNAWTGIPIDLNLEVYDAVGGKLLRASNNVQDSVGKSPVEYVTISSSRPVYVRIKGLGSPGAVDMNIFVQAGEPEILTPGGSIATPGDATLGLSVAATRWDTDKLERYSSQGPTADGRIKPDIAGPTVVSTASYPSTSNKFNGTSAATPHITGAAALFLTANPEATPERIVQFLWGRALDLAPAGVDNQTGHGRAQLGDPPTTPAPPRATPAPVTGTPPASPSASATAARGTPTIRPPASPTRAATPVATATPSPPTPTRPAVRGTPGASFSDPLSTPGGLPDGGEVGHADGRYRIAPSGPNRAAWATYAGVYGNARVEVTVQLAPGTPGAAGIVFWYASPDDYYLFAVSGDGFYQVAHYQGGRWAALTPWTRSAAIVAGGPNRLTLELVGAQLTPGANGQSLGSLGDPGGGGGGLGLLATSFGQAGTVATFADFAVTAGP